MMYKAIVADDEMININIIKKLLPHYFFDLEVVAYTTKIEEIQILVEKYEPEILFLDINFGDQEIFDVLNELNTNAQIIFISAEQKHAVRAFRFDAVDFVLKPISKEILIAAVHKALKKVKLSEDMSPDLVVNIKKSYSKQFITISSMDKHEIFKTSEILYCMADGRCTTFNLVDGRKIHSSKNLTEYDYLLKRQPYFVKISRYYLINFEYVKRIIKKGGPFCEFIEGSVIPISRRKLTELNKFILSKEAR